MFAKLSVAAAAVLPLVSALTLQTPSGLTSAGPATISWTAESTDPPFSLELVNQVFHNSFAIANNVQPGQGSLSLTLPIVPAGDGYSLEAVNVTNINQVYASSGDFSIAPASSTTSSASSTSSGALSMSSGSLASTTGSGITSAPSSSATSPSGSSTSSAATTSVSSFSGAVGQLNLGSAASYAAMLLAGVAGVAVVAL
ncbi:hypothetical protein GLOTRDRAFT_108878 [Gloeophyllum trabeum ATCC 11539]|uniref:Yeast cell wall synthesis Kre9/Knh1-like N-terminal domain-containing protein n=1 Tax=Gloeophyllum trabeum (strain ATCC 11539 / FP-39264 / Madison 617) TaxID=670483 RepID=S7QLK9_GLOTA|nr:uncharacterized protein GLOTRDRAFT_108878 [Gloeophyllum trabeum ATCC 11539]EPQ60277.1 hypothetical protein GLOTRDRAFT_108878 [Gloeophyllum trabeum ATCC 11539]